MPVSLWHAVITYARHQSAGSDEDWGQRVVALATVAATRCTHSPSLWRRLTAATLRHAQAPGDVAEAAVAAAACCPYSCDVWDDVRNTVVGV